MNVNNLMTYPTWERYTVLSHSILHLTIKDRRNIFMIIRNNSVTCRDADIFFPAYGICLSEFAVWHILNEGRRQKKSKTKK